MTASTSESNANQSFLLPPIIQTAEAAPAYWLLGILWIIWVDGEQHENTAIVTATWDVKETYKGKID